MEYIEILIDLLIGHQSKVTRLFPKDTGEWSHRMKNDCDDTANEDNIYHMMFSEYDMGVGASE